MICKFCNEKMPDPEPKVIVQTKVEKVYEEEAIFAVRWIALLGMVIALVLGLHYSYADYVLSKVCSEQSIKVQIKEYDSNGRVTKELTR